MESNARLSPVTTVLTAVCAFLTVSMGLYVIGLGDWMFTAVLAWPGAFLVQSFSVFSLYVPALLGTLARLSARPVSPAMLTALGFSVLPFLTLSALAHVLDPASTVSAAVWLREAMGAPAPVFLGLVTVLELLLGAATTLAVRNATAAPLSGPEPSFHMPSVETDPLDRRPRGTRLRHSQGRVCLRGRAPHHAPTETDTAPTAETPPAPDAEPLQVPYIKEWNTARALRDDPYFVTADQQEYSSPALEALNKTLAGMPLEDDADVFDEEPDWLTATELPDERAALAEIFGPDPEDEREEEPAAIVVDWDHLVPGPAPVAESLDADDFDEDDEPDPAAEEAIPCSISRQRLSAPSKAAIFPVQDHPRPSRTRARRGRTPDRNRLGAASQVQRLACSRRRSAHHVQGSHLRRSRRGHTPRRPHAQDDPQGIQHRGRRHRHPQGSRGHHVRNSARGRRSSCPKSSLWLTTSRWVWPPPASVSSAPIPGKHAVGIEVPNRERTIVGFAEMVGSKEFQESRAEIPMVLGRDAS